MKRWKLKIVFVHGPVFSSIGLVYQTVFTPFLVKWILVPHSAAVFVQGPETWSIG